MTWHYYNKRGVHRKNTTLRGRVQLSYGALFGGALFGILGAYLVVVNTVATKGAEIRSLERRIAALQETVAQKRIQEAQLRTFVRSDEAGEANTLAFVAAEEVRVIVVTGDTAQPVMDEHAVVAIAR